MEILRNVRIQVLILSVANFHPLNPKSEIEKLKILKTELSLSSPIPTDLVFPIGNAQNVLFHNKGRYAVYNDESIVTTLTPEILWEYFEEVYEYNGSSQGNLSDILVNLLGIKRTKVAKTTQAFFLINPYFLFPIDEKLNFLFVEEENYEHLEKRMRNDRENGFIEYINCIHKIQRCFKGCELYELNHLAYLMSKKKERLCLHNNTYWYQIDTHQKGYDKGNYIQSWFKNSIIATGFYPEDKPTFEELRRGDIIVARSGTQSTQKLHGIAVVQSNDLDYDDEDFFKRNILWVLKQENTEISGLARGTISQIKNQEVYNQIKLKFPELWEFLNHFSNKESNKVNVEYPLNLILYGPPGTGKTYDTKKIAAEIISGKKFPENEEGYKEAREIFREEHDKHDRIEFITFHQSYGYEEFVEGIRPVVAESRTNEQGNNSAISYKIKKGAFREICNRAVENSEQNYVLIIDEINRGNVSQIFGELITLIETDKRADNKHQLSVTLPYSGDSFSVPPNLYIIGTMNTADRSLVALDTALRRRFKFKEYRPNPGLVQESIRSAFEEMNKKIREEIDRDHEIGHSYFMNNSLDENELRSIFEQQIIPQLQEYFFDDTTNAKLGSILRTFFEKCDFNVDKVLSKEYYDEFYENSSKS